MVAHFSGLLMGTAGYAAIFVISFLLASVNMAIQPYLPHTAERTPVLVAIPPIQVGELTRFTSADGNFSLLIPNNWNMTLVTGSLVEPTMPPKTSITWVAPSGHARIQVCVFETSATLNQEELNRFLLCIFRCPTIKPKR